MRSLITSSLKLFRSVVLGSCATCCLVSGQDPQTPAYIEGHVVGETIIDYLSRTDGGIQHLAICRLAGNPKQARKRKVDFGECQALISAVDHLTVWTAPRSFMSIGSSSVETEATLNGGKLIQLRVNLSGTERMSLKLVMPDLIARFGVPTQTKTCISTLENPDRRMSAEWNLPQVYVRADEGEARNAKYSTVTVTVLTAEEYDLRTGKSVHHTDLLE
jgi:hypothetical protein